MLAEESLRLGQRGAARHGQAYATLTDQQPKAARTRIAHALDVHRPAVAQGQRNALALDRGATGHACLSARRD
jgi:hypothetical protein